MKETSQTGGQTDIQAVDMDNFPMTRQSLLCRIRHLEDPSGWNEFISIYGRLIYRVASRRGLSDADAQDLVQETYIAVMKGIAKFKHDPDKKSFRRWLRTIVRNKCNDKYRNLISMKEFIVKPNEKTENTTAINKIGDILAHDLGAIWDAEWAKNEMALLEEHVKKLVSIEQFQIFDLYVRQEWSAIKVAKVLKVSIASVYLAKTRVCKLFKAVRKDVEKAMWLPRKKM